MREKIRSIPFGKLTMLHKKCGRKHKIIVQGGRCYFEKEMGNFDNSMDQSDKVWTLPAV